VFCVVIIVVAIVFCNRRDYGERGKRPWVECENVLFFWLTSYVWSHIRVHLKLANQRQAYYW
jgi:hypothetical protein